MKKHILDLQVVSCEHIYKRYMLLKLTDSTSTLPLMMPGQFAHVRVGGSANTFLRRPFSIHFVDYDANELHMLIQIVGAGTAKLSSLRMGDVVNVVLPLGNGFSLPEEGSDKVLLLIGGGVGVAPLLYLGICLERRGCKPSFLIGGKSKNDLLQLSSFERYGDTYVTTEDGSAGLKGLVTQHSILQDKMFDMIFCCGPKPMMMAVAQYARTNEIACEVSLENMMACGIGACLCCVEDTQRGNVCVCTEGPVFNIDELKWPI